MVVVLLVVVVVVVVSGEIVVNEPSLPYDVPALLGKNRDGKNRDSAILWFHMFRVAVPTDVF